jgi:hypothetical protein
MTRPNTSLDASADRVFFDLPFAFDVVANRRGQSTLTFAL